MTTPVFEVRDAGIDRGGRAQLDGVSLTLAAGEVVCLLGENGAGKSTLLRLLAGDLAPHRGSVSLHGRPLASWSALEQARLRAVLPQESTLALGFSGLEVVLLGRSPHDGGRHGAMDRAIARDAMRRIDAWQFADRSFPTLSGGERARVMLARVCAQVMDEAPGAEAPPRALLLDEPTAALDIAHQHAAFAALRRLAVEHRIAVLVVLHDPNLALRYADRVALIHAGRLMHVGPVDDTLTDDLLTACFSIRMRRVETPDHPRPLLYGSPA